MDCPEIDISNHLESWFPPTFIQFNNFSRIPVSIWKYHQADLQRGAAETS